MVDYYEQVWEEYHYVYRVVNAEYITCICYDTEDQEFTVSTETDLMKARSFKQRMLQCDEAVFENYATQIKHIL